MKKTAIVTGANIGLGLAITKELAARDFKVIMACRNEEKARGARDALRSQFPHAEVETAQLDLSSLDSVSEFVASFSEKFGALDLLINNAGITGMPLLRNDRGHELHLATNYLGPFALIGGLLPLLRSAEGARIVNVNSLAHRNKEASDLSDLNWARGQYEPMVAYGRSKFALMMFTLELQRRLQKEGSGIVALNSHPGYAATDILSKPGSTMTPKNPMRKLSKKLFLPLVPTPEKAARATIFAALDKNAVAGGYYGPAGLFEIAGKPGPAKINPAAHNADAARELWKISEEMTGVHYLD